MRFHLTIESRLSYTVVSSRPMQAKKAYDEIIRSLTLSHSALKSYPVNVLPLKYKVNIVKYDSIYRNYVLVY